MIERVEYMNALKKWRGEKVIKVVTGLRRCGKSTLLNMLLQYLLEDGIASNQIISVNLESLEYESLLNYRALYRYITQRLQPNAMNYVFLDEVQLVEDVRTLLDKVNTLEAMFPRRHFTLDGHLVGSVLMGLFVKWIGLMMECRRETARTLRLKTPWDILEFGRRSML